jgi:hypothetical protein
VQKVRGVNASYDLSPPDAKRPSSSEVDAEKESGTSERRCAQNLDCFEGEIPLDRAGQSAGLERKSRRGQKPTSRRRFAFSMKLRGGGHRASVSTAGRSRSGPKACTGGPTSTCLKTWQKPNVRTSMPNDDPNARLYVQVGCEHVRPSREAYPSSNRS